MTSLQFPFRGYRSDMADENTPSTFSSCPYSNNFLFFIEVEDIKHELHIIAMTALLHLGLQW